MSNARAGSGGGGSGGKGGVPSFGGSPTAAGSGGVGGKATGGAAGGGAAGASQGGSGGASGGGGGVPTYEALEGFHVEYMAINKDDAGPYISAQLDIVNDGPLTVPLSELTLHYYFTNEIANELRVSLNWSNSGPTPYAELKEVVTPTVAEYTPATLAADRYIEFSFAATDVMVTPGTTVKVSWQLGAVDNMGTFAQTDDWSYNPAHTELTEWDHIVLLRNGDFAWGNPPN